MKSIKIQLPNQQGIQLSARLELPLDSHPQTYAIFAHCFTCNKNLTAVRNISRALTQNGIAVLRFDFTGLGESEGEFADTNFSSNVTDLVAAAQYLNDHYQAPEILIGHSLGGAAVLMAAHDLPTIKAVATIGAPAEPVHVTHLLEDSVGTIEQTGNAEVTIGGRPFKVKKQFLDDLNDQNIATCIHHLNKALLVLHSPQDLTVTIDNAAKIYKTARHPKSYVSLDGADHLLSNKADSLYVGEVIATWAKRYITIPPPPSISAIKRVATRTGAVGYTTDIKAGRHYLTGDEPESVGGNDFGPTPYDFLAASLGTCTGMTLRMYADRKKWDVQNITVHLQHSKEYPADYKTAKNKKVKIDKIERILEIEGNLDEKQRKRLLEIADKCPVHRTLHGDIVVETKLKG